MTNSIEIHRPANRRDQWDADENTPRIKIYEAVIPQSFISRPEKDYARIGEEVADYVFHILNAPEEILDEEDLKIATDFRALDNYSLSTGDVVVVDDEYFLCESVGWKKIETPIYSLGIRYNHI
jgi:hypothetical protein